jgi:hypothetical protein
LGGYPGRIYIDTSDLHGMIPATADLQGPLPMPYQGVRWLTGTYLAFQDPYKLAGGGVIGPPGHKFVRAGLGADSHTGGFRAAIDLCQLYPPAPEAPGQRR